MNFRRTNIQWMCVFVLGTAALGISGCGGSPESGRQTADMNAEIQSTSELESGSVSADSEMADMKNAEDSGGFGSAIGSQTEGFGLGPGEQSAAEPQSQPDDVSDEMQIVDAPSARYESLSADKSKALLQRAGQQQAGMQQTPLKEEGESLPVIAADFFGESEMREEEAGSMKSFEKEAPQLSSPTTKKADRGMVRRLDVALKAKPIPAPADEAARNPRGAIAAGLAEASNASPVISRGKSRVLGERLFESRLRKSGLSPQQQKVLRMDLQPGEELWVIAKAAPATSVANDIDTPGCGALMAKLPNQTTQVPVPLKHTSVEGNIDGYIASVDVTQQFHNPFNSKIEAVYVFPLPQNAAVNEFVMTVGDRKIRGIIREREKAEKIYAAARAQGHVAALMTQERANIFTQKVANIEPGKKIDINIRYFNTLRYDDGAYEFVFPMVVGPRFNPAATTDGVGAVARGQQNTSGQKTEVQYLAPNERSGHDISVSLNISAGVDVEDVNCINHAVDVTNVSECQRKVTLSAQDTIPNKDFVLRYKVAGDQIKTAMLTHKDEHGSYFTMMLYPPADLEQVQRSPMEMVFVLDCSGSMRGKPMVQAKAAISHALQSLTPRDTFQIIRFSNNASQLGADPVLATDDNVKRGLDYLTSLSGSGGTQMIEGIKAALDFPHDEGRFRLVSFMTDGYIGNEQQILGTIDDKLGASRIFSFGVGSSPNRMLMDRMAVLGRGAVAYLSLNDNATEIMDRFNRRISHPAMTDLSIDWGQMNVTDVYPQRIPDLIVGRPVVFTGRFEGEPSLVTVNGRVDMETTSFAVSLDEEEATAQHTGIAAVWARLKIKDLMNLATQATDATEEIHQTVTQTALAYNLMSSYTAFVAVDSMTKTDGDFGTTVAVPALVPDGVKYETTVGGTN